MKNQITGNKMNQPEIIVTASLREPQILTCIVERLACLRHDMGYSHEKVNAGWQALDTSSIEAFVDGYVNLSDNSDMISMPFMTSLIFTCYKIKGGDYSLAWLRSLS